MPSTEFVVHSSCLRTPSNFFIVSFKKLSFNMTVKIKIKSIWGILINIIIAYLIFMSNSHDSSKQADSHVCLLTIIVSLDFLVGTEQKRCDLPQKKFLAIKRTRKQTHTCTPIAYHVWSQIERSSSLLHASAGKLVRVPSKKKIYRYTLCSKRLTKIGSCCASDIDRNNGDNYSWKVWAVFFCGVHNAN